MAFGLNAQQSDQLLSNVAVKNHVLAKRVTSGAVFTANLNANSAIIDQLTNSSDNPTGIPVVNPVWFGADPTGVADSAPAVRLAIADLPSTGGIVAFPAGKFRLNSAIAFTFPDRMYALHIHGAGQDATILRFPDSDGFVYTWTNQENSFHFSDLAITTDAQGEHTGVTVASTFSAVGYQQGCLNQMSRVTFQGDTGVSAIKYWGTAISIQAVSFVNFYGLLFYGGSQTGVGLYLRDYDDIITANYNINNCSFLNLDKGISTFNNPQGVCVVSTAFVDNNTGIYTSGPNLLVGMQICNSNFDNRINNINIAGDICDLQITGNTFYVTSTSNPSIWLQSVNRFTILGNNQNYTSSSTNTTVGILVGQTSGWPGVITGNVFSGPLSVAILLSNTSSLINVQSNAYGATVVTRVQNNGSGNTVGGGSS